MSGSNGFSNGLYTAQIFVHPVRSHFHLGGAIARVQQTLGICDELVDAPVQPFSVRVIGMNFLLAEPPSSFQRGI